MKKIITLSILITFVLNINISYAQCNDFQMQMQNAVSGFYDLSDNVFEANVLIDKLVQDVSSEDFSSNLSELKLFVKGIKSNADYLNGDMELALSNAEMCYCRNGQKYTFMLLDDLELINEKTKSISKLLKSTKKAEGDELIEILSQIDKYLKEVSELSTKAPDNCIIASEACN